MDFDLVAVDADLLTTFKTVEYQLPLPTSFYVDKRSSFLPLIENFTRIMTQYRNLDSISCVESQIQMYKSTATQLAQSIESYWWCMGSGFFLDTLPFAAITISHVLEDLESRSNR